ncbi:MAG: ATP-binding protein [Patescibacteria group bacterium]
MKPKARKKPATPTSAGKPGKPKRPVKGKSGPPAVVKKVVPAAPKPLTQLPEWFIEGVSTPYRSGIANSFIVHGDINGLFPNPDSDVAGSDSYITLTKFWEAVFGGRELVVFYNIADGLRFLDSSMEALFKEAAGIKEDDSGANPIAAAKAGLKAKRGLPREPEVCLPLLEKALVNQPEMAVVIEAAHLVAPAMNLGAPLPMNERTNIERLKHLGRDERIREKGNIVVMVTEQSAKVSAELKYGGSGIQTVLIPKPSKPEREKLIANFATADLLNFDQKSFAQMTQGLNNLQIREIFSQAKVSGKPIDADAVKVKKREILNAEYGEIMEIVEPEKGLDDIGGLKHVKDYLNDVLTAIRKGDTRLVPMGVMLFGPPGTGKTAIVEALAKEAGFNFVKIKNVRSMWVGESEARMEKMITGLRALAPVVVMNDESDLAEANRDAPKGDSGVAERLMRAWMELRSNPRIRGQIIVIDCTNRPDRIDAALKRSGRTDDRILLPMPSEDERADIFRVMFKRHEVPTSLKDFRKFAEKTDGISGADIERISLKAFSFARAAGEKEVSGAVLEEAIADFIPSASQKDIDLMTLVGVLESSSRRLMPPHIKEIVHGICERKLVNNLDGMMEQIKARKIL